MLVAKEKVRQRFNVWGGSDVQEILLWVWWWWAVEVDSKPWEQWGPQPYNHKGWNSANKNNVGSRSIPGPPHENLAQPTFDFSLVIPNRKPSHDAMQIADLWNYELTNRCFFKPLSLWQFVMQQQKTNTACLSEVFSSPKHTCDIFSAAVVPHTHSYRTSH